MEGQVKAAPVPLRALLGDTAQMRTGRPIVCDVVIGEFRDARVVEGEGTWVVVSLMGGGGIPEFAVFVPGTGALYRSNGPAIVAVAFNSVMVNRVDPPPVALWDAVVAVAVLSTPDLLMNPTTFDRVRWLRVDRGAPV